MEKICEVVNRTFFKSKEFNENSYYLFEIKSYKDKCMYFCYIECDQNKNYIKLRDLPLNANAFDLANALFQSDIDVYPILPKNLVTEKMDRIWEMYHAGLGNNSIYRNINEYNNAYQEEERRVSKVKVKKKV